MLETNEKLEVVQDFIDGMNSLTIRFAPLGVDSEGKYIKKAGGYFSGAEIKYVKEIHEDITDGMITKIDAENNTYSDFDGATKAKPLKTKAKEKMKEKAKYVDEEDMDAIVDVYFDNKNKDKVGDKAKKVK